MRLAPPGTAPAPPARARARSGLPPAPPAPARRGVRVRLRPVPLVLAGAVAGWLGWAATTDGGIPARVDGAVDRVRGAVDEATADPGLHRATSWMQDEYERAGKYPALTEARLREDPDVDWGIGVTVYRCGPQAVVLRAINAHGTVSRLLVSGATVGDVQGPAACPTDLGDPAPWTR